jgi:hypothetical protein
MRVFAEKQTGGRKFARSVFHREEGDLFQLANEIAMNAYREGKLRFPDGSITIAGERLGGNTNV